MEEIGKLAGSVFRHALRLYGKSWLVARRGRPYHEKWCTEKWYWEKQLGSDGTNEELYQRRAVTKEIMKKYRFAVRSQELSA